MENLEKEFVPYEEALALKELGFDEPCFGFYTEEYKGLIKKFCRYPINLPTKPFLAPTYSQAFRWFRKNHNLSPIISKFGYAIENQYGQLIYEISDDENPMSYEEAELTCLKKLIELISIAKDILVYPGYMSFEAGEFFKGYLESEERNGCAVVGSFVTLADGKVVLPSKGDMFTKDEKGLIVALKLTNH